MHFWSVCVLLISAFFLLGYRVLEKVMDSLSSSASTVPSFDDYFRTQHVGHPLLELLFLEQVSGIFASFVVEIDLAMVALYCHFALDSVAKKARMILHYLSSSIIAHGPYLSCVASLSPPWLRDLFVVSAFATALYFYRGTTVTSLYVEFGTFIAF